MYGYLFLFIFNFFFTGNFAEAKRLTKKILSQKVIIVITITITYYYYVIINLNPPLSPSICLFFIVAGGVES